MFLFSGTSGLSVGDAGPQAVSNADDANWTGDATRDRPDFPGAGWTTYAERLQASGISWTLYQEYDNFGDNSLAFFKAFRGLAPSDSLYQRGRAIVPARPRPTPSRAAPTISSRPSRRTSPRTGCPKCRGSSRPTKYSEHPEAPPALGESLTARFDRGAGRQPRGVGEDRLPAQLRRE